MYHSKNEFWQKAIDANPELTRIGQPWSKDEEQNLLDRISEGKSINEISVEFKRAQGGIKSRLKVVATEMLNSGKSIMEVSKLTGIRHSALKQSAAAHKIPVKGQTKIREINTNPSVFIKDVIDDHTYKNDITELLSLTRDIHSMMKEFIAVAVKPPVIIKKVMKSGCLIQDD